MLSQLVNFLDLANTWVVAVVQSGRSGDDRTRRWPAVFTQRGLRSSFVHKISMFGAEGPHLNLDDKAISTSAHGTSTTDFGLVAQEQTADYDFDKVAAEATAALRL